ncbi:MAG: nucleotidyl transferase AbiEii/AbiGii toxin family protein [Clostridiales bacterium]|nr:nucleotidyl transferase AbiEii/AbiGii toxin family protein [Clostridiales bacterium]
MMNITKSVLQKLKNKSQSSGLSFQLLMQLFCQEEFLRRISYSEFQNKLVLKGGLFLYLITNFESRPTMDIDFLMKNWSNEDDKIMEMIRSIINTISANEFIKFEIKYLNHISEQKEYHGVRIKMIGVVGNTRTPFDIDIGVGDVVIPRPNKRKLDVLLPEFSSPEVLTYSLESTIAEKWDAIIDRMEFNSRMKDFYDIYYLAMNYDFDGRKLQEAIFETLDNRGRIYDKNTLKKVSSFKKDRQIVLRWNAFVQNTIKVDIDFDDVINVITDFIREPFESIIYERELFLRWSKSDGEWN